MGMSMRGVLFGCCEREVEGWITRLGDQYAWLESLS